MIVSVILVISLNLLHNIVKSECSNYDQQYSPNDEVVRSKQHQLNLDQDMIIGIGFWMSYRPLEIESLPQNSNGSPDPNRKLFFIYCLKPIYSEMLTLLFYIEFSQPDYTISHNMILQTDSQNFLPIYMDVNTYEGSWIFTYIYINRLESQVKINYQQLNSDQIKQDVFGGQLLLDNEMISTTGGYIDFQLDDSQILYLQTYPGLIHPVIFQLQDYFLQNIEEFFFNCYPIICQTYEATLVSDTTHIQNSKVLTSLETDSQIYIFQGWVKQDEIGNSQTQEAVLIKITVNSQNSDNSKIENRLLQIKYYQSILNLQQNGFSLQTYSYTYPLFPQIYIPDDTDTIYFLGEQYMNLLTQWHYIQFQLGTQIGQPIYTVYYSATEQTESYTWNKRINHFKVPHIYVIIGEDNYALYPFKGYLNGWVFIQLCKAEIANIQLSCHYKCKTCKGFSSEDCLSCEEEKYRFYSASTNTCNCNLGYFDVQGTAQCQELNIYKRAFYLYEQEITKTKKGYYSTDENNIICEFGYFKYNNYCIECPYSVQDQIIRCADCIIYPDIFSQTLICTFQFVSEDEDSPFIYRTLSDDEKEYYSISDTTIENQQKLKFRKGFLANKCKNGYFLQKNECHECPENCDVCLDQQICQKCSQGYKIISPGICLVCETCSIYISLSGDGSAVFEFCRPGQYLSYDKQCFDCRSYCQTCDFNEGQCQYCVDNQKYFITMDAFHCIQCPIEKCKYCFQYYINSDQVIVNTLDYGAYSDSINGDIIITACALCETNYFYSFVSQKCEAQPEDMIDCQFGIKLDDYGTNQCIISSTRTDAIQQPICPDQYCTSCINDYSIEVSSFCISCYPGFYSSYYTGLCIKCPSPCLTCVMFDQTYNNKWKWEIRAFYQYFINRNNDHPFDINHSSKIEVVCLSCYRNYQLISNTCKQTCSQDCSKCDIVTELNTSSIWEWNFQCNQCIPDTFNSQRSVILSQKSQCQGCPELCSACIPRSSEQITALNPFFDQTSSYQKYSHICYQTDRNSGINIKPLYFVPNKCQDFTKCDNKISINLFVYCNNNAYWDALYTKTDDKPKIFWFYLIIYKQNLEILQTQEMFEYMNKLQITEITYRLEMISFQSWDFCNIMVKDFLYIKNIWKKYVFTLKYITLHFFKTQKNEEDKIPILIQTPHFTIIDFHKIIFEDIQFVTFYEGHTNYHQLYRVANIYFINEYDPVTLIFKNCEIFSNYLQESTILSFTSNRPQELIIQAMRFQGLNIYNSHIFDLQPFSEYQNVIQNINSLFINNSIFTNTSIFQYKAFQFSLNQILNFTNVTIINTNFQTSFFIDTQFEFNYNIGELYLENFHLENLTLQNNSVFFNIINALKCNVKNLSVINVKFLDKSSLLISNILNIELFSVINSIIDQGILLNIYQKAQQSITIVNNLKCSHISFINTTYSNSNSFIRILSSDLTKYNFFCSDLLLYNNVYAYSVIGKQSFIQYSYQQSLIFIDCINCSLINLNIYRGIGLPEISIINSQSLFIQSLLIQTNPKYFKRFLHSSFECLQKFLYLDIPFVLYIIPYQTIELNNIDVQNTIVIGYQLLYFFGKNSQQQIVSEKISIKNSVFQNNVLLNINENKQTTLLYIETQQASIINITNVKFQNNFLNQYYTSALEHSSTTLLIQAKLGEINFQSSKFIQNSITNSTDSVLYVWAKTVIINFSNFSNQNIINEELFQKGIITLDDSIIFNSDLYNEFSILSNGGNGYIQANQVEIKNTLIQNSLAINGGGFYFVTNGAGIILLENCSIQNTSTILNGNQLASGGAFYIDSSNSFLNLTIVNCEISQTYARTQGGTIYIEPSKSQNHIQLDHLFIQSVFSIQHSFLSFSPSKQISIISEIIITHSKFQNFKLDFENYVSKITDLQEQNIILFQTDNPLIYVQFSNFTMSNCYFENIHLTFLLKIEQGIQISLNNLTIQNSSIFQSPIIKLSLRTDTSGNIILRNLIVQNLIVYPLQNQQQCNSFGITYNKQYQLCPSALAEISSAPKIIQNQQDLQNQIQCNLNQFYTIIYEVTFSIIEINNIKYNQLINIQELRIFDIQCAKCQYGMLSIQSFASKLHLQLENINLIHNNCGVLGCLSIIKSVDNIDLSQFNLSSYNDTKQGEQLEKYNISLTNSLFVENTASYGGACFLSEVDILINNSLFLNNKATILGGAIYYNADQTNIFLINSSIVKNSANIGGGLYLKQQQLQSIDQIKLFIQENEAIFAQNLYEIPKYLYLSLDNVNVNENIQIFRNSSTIIEKIKIIPYKTFFSNSTTDVLYLPSGIKFSSYNYFHQKNNSYIPFNLNLRLQVQNQFAEKISNLENTKCDISSYILDISNPYAFKDLNLIKINKSQYISKSTVVFNMETGDYNLDDLVIYFNPYQNINYVLQLAFLCNSIEIPFYNSSSLEKPNIIINNYILLLNVKTFQCQLGEIFNQSSGGCVLCDISERQYSVLLNASFCSYKDETKIQSIQSATIQLRPNYWRAYYYSDIIEECHNLLANCEGGWFAGDPSCATGHIGALCEQCDLYNVKGQGSYSSNLSYQCSNCDQSAQNILNILFVILWALISLFITVTSTIKMIDDLIFQLKLRPLGFITIVESASTSILLKVFTNYLQIVSSIASFQLEIPMGITLAVRGVGNPIASVAFSFNCYLKQISNIPMLYFSVIWGFAIAGMYIFLIFFFHILISFKDKKKLNITFVTTTLIYVYIYLSPNLVSQLSSLISYRNISGQKWIASNVAYLYNTEQHKKWLIYFVSPTFLIIGIILPLFFWYIVHHHRFSLNSQKTRRVWGYLYNEYKVSTHYWETIKIIQKELIILILIYYEDFVAIKACLILFLLHIYSKLTSKFKPYLTQNLNQIDSLSTSICKSSIVLAQSIYLAQNLAIIEVIWPFYIVLAFINCLFIFEMISKLIFAYFDKLYEVIDKIKAIIYHFLPFYFKKQRVCKRLLQNTSERKQIVRQRFQQIRLYLINQAKILILFKKQNNIGLQSKLANLYARTPFQNSKIKTLIQEQPNIKLCATEVL